jgi:hypothetical protein
MARQRYVQVRMPADAFDKLMGKKREMEADLQKVTGRNISLKNTQFFNAITDLNENSIQIDLGSLASLVNKRRKINGF